VAAHRKSEPNKACQGRNRPGNVFHDMTTEGSPESRPPFARSVLPWVVAAAALVIYLTTLSHWVTLNSLPLTAKVADWDWQPMIVQPVLFLVTFPMRWVPAGHVPLALNPPATCHWP
jgi:hypothetical protein